jgi:murein DD-endopeptidase MepM/ murein hydrolase activator NlpD
MRRVRNPALRVPVAAAVAATLAMPGAGVARAIDFSGGTPGPVAVVATGGTGGTLYVLVAPKPRPARKQSHAARRPHATSKPKPTPRKPAPLTAPKPAPPTPPAVSEAGVPSPAQTAGEGAVFPVVGSHSFGDAANGFGAPRAGHTHQGQDVLAGEGTRVVAPLAGAIVTTGYQASAAGWYVAEHTGVGLDFFYAHCQAGTLAVSTGEAVLAGQALCDVGQTGDATAPHLHFEIWVGGWQAPGGHPIDPLPYLQAWERR